MFTMLLNSFYQMAQVILYAFINEAKEHALWQETSTIYHYTSLYITVYHHINSIFIVYVYIHTIYIHTHIHYIYLYVCKGLLHLHHNPWEDKDVTASHHLQSRHWH